MVTNESSRNATRSVRQRYTWEVTTLHVGSDDAIGHLRICLLLIKYII